MLLPGTLPPSRWVAHAIAEDLGTDPPALDETWAHVDDEASFDAWSRAQGWPRDAARSALGRARATACEHLLNDRAGQPELLRGGLEPRFGDGRSVELLRLPPEQSAFERKSYGPLAGAWAEAGLPRLDFVPMHPQEAEARGFDLEEAGLGGRATASGRTVRLRSAPLLLKCDLAHVVMDRRRRPLGAGEASVAVKTTAFVHRALLRRRELGQADAALCFLPEASAVVDTSRDLGCVVRSANAWPAGAAGTWLMPSYCLFSDASELGGQTPLLAQIVSRWTSSDPGDHPRSREATDVFVTHVIEPLVEVGVSILLDLGCAYMAHGQNLLTEIDDHGLPTGRFCISDLMNLFEQPDLCEHLGLEADLGEEHIAMLAAHPEAKPTEAFQDYFLWSLLHPLLLCFERTVCDDGRARSHANAWLRDRIRARADVVRAFRTTSLAWLYERFLA